MASILDSIIVPIYVVVGHMAWESDWIEAVTLDAEEAIRIKNEGIVAYGSPDVDFDIETYHRQLKLKVTLDGVER